MNVRVCMFFLCMRPCKHTFFYILARECVRASTPNEVGALRVLILHLLPQSAELCQLYPASLELHSDSEVSRFLDSSGIPSGKDICGPCCRQAPARLMYCAEMVQKVAG